MRWICVVVVLAMGCEPTPQLVDISDEPAGENCPHGGTAIAIGFDENYDGELAESEVDSIEYVCDGDDGGGGSDGTEVLVETALEPIGGNCPNGGTAIDIGVDVSSNGVLEESEVQRTVYVCNATDGTATLVGTRPEPVGSNCELGGVAILVGSDLDDDDILDPEEVTSTSFVCNGSTAMGVLNGSVTIENDLDLRLLAGIKFINGNVRIDDAGPLVEIHLPDLEQTGNIILLGNLSSTQRSVRLPRLRMATGVFLQGVFEVDLSALETLSTPAFDVLNLVIADSVIDVILLPELRTSGGVNILRSPQLTQFVVPKLDVVHGEVTIVDLASLPSINMPNVTSVGGINIGGVPILSELLMPSIATIGGPVFVTAPQLPECQVTDILAQASYTGPRTIQAAPCP